MLDSFDRSTWVENVSDELERDRITVTTDESIVRKHYPYKVIIRKNNPAYKLVKGDIISYARVKHVPQYFPIEAITYNGTKPLKKLHLNSEEAQLIED